MRFVTIAILASALCAFGQTTTPTFPTVPLPTAVAGFISYNQLGDPRVTGGVSAIEDKTMADIGRLIDRLDGWHLDYSGTVKLRRPDPNA